MLASQTERHQAFSRMQYLSTYKLLKRHTRYTYVFFVLDLSFRAAYTRHNHVEGSHASPSDIKCNVIANSTRRGTMAPSKLAVNDSCEATPFPPDY